MNTTYLGNPLIGELLADSSAFVARGKAYQLLDEYFAGLSVETLRPLLKHPDVLIKRAAIWVASELGADACAVLDDVAPLIDSDDRSVGYHALEVTVVCAVGSRVDRFVGVPRALESSDDVIRVLAMRLLTRADLSQLEAAARLAGRIPDGRGMHERGLRLLMSGDSLEGVRRMLNDDDAIARRYGAIAVKRLREKYPDLVHAAVELRDTDISRFMREAA